MLSKSSQYALTAVIYLARHTNENNKIQVAELAKKIDAPKPFLGKILQNLSAHELISATKGRNGGFYLTKEQKKGLVYTVIITTDGHDVLRKCILGLPECNSEQPCALHYLVQPGMQSLRSNLKELSLEQAANLLH